MRTLGVVLGVLLLAAPAAAEERVTLVGTVESATAGELKVRDSERGSVSVQLGSATRYVKGSGEARRTDLVKGARVVIQAEQAGGRWTAQVIRIGNVRPVHVVERPGGKTPARTHSAGSDDVVDPHAGHLGAPAPTASGPGRGGYPHPFGRRRPRLFQSDMTLMAGTGPYDPMGGMAMPRWHFMTSGIVRGQYNRQGGPRGGSAVESTNWTMVMGQRDVAGGRLTLMLMNSLEPATLRPSGTPQLFQTGETFEGRPLVDRQHPHDFFMNLSATYRRPLEGDAAWWVQLAPRGEPALGPTTYMHRASAGDNPAAILSHHFQDSTHIADSVVTAGVGWRRVSVEVSAFHGQEPDEARWDLDPGALDSASARVKVRLPSGWSAQVSHGFLESPEALEEGDVRRTTASIHYGELGDTPFAASLVWGRNREDHGTFDGLVVEGAWQPTRRDQLYARAEAVDRDVHLLEHGEVEAHGEEGEAVNVRALTAGYVRDLKSLHDVPVVRDLVLGLGADVTLYGIPARLESVYGDTRASLHVYGRLRWGSPHDADGGHEQRPAHH